THLGIRERGSVVPNQSSAVPISATPPDILKGPVLEVFWALFRFATAARSANSRYPSNQPGR
ncbi:hypothetical protein J6590_108107, partial [Homalodisca vitripennis]